MDADWANPLVKKGTLSREMGETTPFVYAGRLYRVENWQKYFDIPGSNPGDRYMEDEVRLRDMETDRIVSVPFVGHSFGYAFVWEERVYVYALRHRSGPWREFTEIDLTVSSDLRHWSEPETVIRAEGPEHLFNVAVCRGADRFILLFETNDPRWPPFTFQYCQSTDLVHWDRIPKALYGREKYVGGPALYYAGGWYYTLYLQDLDGYAGGTWETRLTRSRDLLHWEDAPLGRPFLAPDRSRVFTYEHFGRKVEVREVNASDAELCYWQGKTIVYFNGGDQQTSGDLQLAEFEGTPQELFERFYIESTLALPAERQLAIQERQLGAFIHFGMAAWYGGSGTAQFPPGLFEPYAFNLEHWGAMVAQPPAGAFNPSGLDAAQWVAAAQAMGARHLVLTAKHHNGFCLWPTRTTPYSVSNSPWRGGRGDVLREVADAARAAGLGLGLYISAGDVSQGCFSTPEPQGQRRLLGDLEGYAAVFEAQLREILTGYGELCEIWLDGALDPFGPDVLRRDGMPVGRAYWDHFCAIMRELQPGAAIMGGMNPDVLVSDNEEGLAPYPLWNAAPSGAAGWVVPEAIVFTRPTWFWTPGSDEAIFSLERLHDIYLRSVGHGANLLINMTPDPSGLIPAAEVQRLAGFGQELRRRYGAPLAEMSSAERWDEGQCLELTLGPGARVGAVLIEEDLSCGQRVEAYRLEAEVDGAWVVAGAGQSIGRQRIQLLAPLHTRALRLRVLKSAPLPKIRRFAAC
jgi:alpha-L-fucosidase